jgi:hypothetical protein
MDNIKKLQKEISDHYKKISSLNNSIRKEYQKEYGGYIGKYMYFNGSSTKKWIYVKNVNDCEHESYTYIDFIIDGFTFNDNHDLTPGRKSQYLDIENDTLYTMQIDEPGNDIENINAYKEITKEEYDKAFDKMINQFKKI